MIVGDLVQTLFHNWNIVFVMSCLILILSSFDSDLSSHLSAITFIFLIVILSSLSIRLILYHGFFFDRC